MLPIEAPASTGRAETVLLREVVQAGVGVGCSGRGRVSGKLLQSFLFGQRQGLESLPGGLAKVVLNARRAEIAHLMYVVPMAFTVGVAGRGLEFCFAHGVLAGGPSPDGGECKVLKSGLRL